MIDIHNTWIGAVFGDVCLETKFGLGYGSVGVAGNNKVDALAMAQGDHVGSEIYYLRRVDVRFLVRLDYT